MIWALNAFAVDFVVPQDGTVEDALTAAVASGAAYEVVVEPGEYETPTAVFSDAQVTVRALVPGSVVLRTSAGNGIRFADSTVLLDGLDFDCVGRCLTLDASEVVLTRVRSMAQAIVKPSNGGFARVTGGSLSISNSRFEASSVDGSGGHLQLLDSELSLNNVVFVGGTATSNGGSVSTLDGSVVASRTLWMGASATSNGGTIDFRDGSLTLLDSTLMDGVAGSTGGLIFARGETIVDRSVLCSATANAGGLLAWRNEANQAGGLSANSSAFVLGSAIANGGGVRLLSSPGAATANLSRPTFFANQSPNRVDLDMGTDDPADTLSLVALITDGSRAVPAGTGAIYGKTGPGSAAIVSGDWFDTTVASFPIGVDFDFATYQQRNPGFGNVASCDFTSWTPNAGGGNRGAVHAAGIFDADGDGAVAGEDCEEGDATRFRGAIDIACNGIDEDCDGRDSRAGAPVWFLDSDSDGFGDGTTSVEACEQPERYVDVAGDCDDSDAGRSPGNLEVCDASEVDEDCDVSTLLGPIQTWFFDGDMDGFGTAAVFEMTCEQPLQHVQNGTDCDDADPRRSPAGVEVCDPAGLDEDCDPTTLAPQTAYFVDDDGDGVGAGPIQMACELPVRSALVDGDCDDNNGAVFPGAIEICGNGVDDDCLGGDLVPVPYYPDADRDGFGDEDGPVDMVCDPPDNTTPVPGDCNDADPTVNPGAVDVCGNGVDDDCDGMEPPLLTFFADRDEDGFGDDEVVVQGCEPPPGFVAMGGDCDPTVTSLDNQCSLELVDGGCGCAVGTRPALAWCLAPALLWGMRRRRRDVPLTSHQRS